MIFEEKFSQNNLCFKIIFKLVFYYHITKIVVNEYDFRLKVKTMVNDYGVRFYETIVTYHDFNFKLKTVITN